MLDQPAGRELGGQEPPIVGPQPWEGSRRDVGREGDEQVVLERLALTEDGGGRLDAIDDVKS
jgi:hypothetical protein